MLAKHGEDGFVAGLQRQGFQRLGGPGRELRSPRRRDRLQAGQGRHDLHPGRIRRLRRSAGIQAAAGRQQRLGHSLSRLGRHGLRRHVRVAGARFGAPHVRQARRSAVSRLGLRHGPRRARLPAADRPMEFPGGDRPGPQDQGGIERHVILDADLSQVKEFMHNSPHPGKDRTKGYFGFAGHSDPVEFRNVRIKRLSGTSGCPVGPFGAGGAVRKSVLEDWTDASVVQQIAALWRRLEITVSTVGATMTRICSRRQRNASHADSRLVGRGEL